MKPRERRETGAQDMFRSRLDQIINLKHEAGDTIEDGVVLVDFLGSNSIRLSVPALALERLEPLTVILLSCSSEGF